MQRTNTVLAVFVVLAIALASLSALEYSMLGTQKTTTMSEIGTSVLSTTTVTSTVTTLSEITVTASSLPYVLPPDEHCCFVIQTADNVTGTTFAYTELNGSIPAASYALDNVTSFTLDNVRFSIVVSLVGQAQHGLGCYLWPPTEAGYVQATFSDGTSERLNPCLVLGAPSMAVLLTSHVNPQAGFLISGATGGFYFLVSTTP